MEGQARAGESEGAARSGVSGTAGAAAKSQSGGVLVAAGAERQSADLLRARPAKGERRGADQAPTVSGLRAETLEAAEREAARRETA